MNSNGLEMAAQTEVEPTSTYNHKYVIVLKYTVRDKAVKIQTETKKRLWFKRMI